MESLTLFSPAKINLFLHITGRRPDGYHEIASLFQAVSLGDHLTIQFSQNDRLICSNPSLPIDARNLILKAVKLFRRKTGCRDRFSIELQKNIPTEAGLGGGSSNAAATLWGLNELTDRTISLEDLQQWSKEIGSDCPFFFSHGTAYCTGRGEIVQNLHLTPWLDTIEIFKPTMGLSTPAVYQNFRKRGLLSNKSEAEKSLASWLNGKQIYINDLEAAAFQEMPYLESLKHELLKAGFKNVLLSGSGTAFFCLGGSEIPCILPEVKNFRIKTINRSHSAWYFHQ